MSKNKPTNLAASIRQKLLNLSKQRSQDFQFTLTRYALERLLYRLSLSEYSNQFVLKGAVMFLVWAAEPYRPTRDLDLLGFGESSAPRLLSLFKNLCKIEDEDGLILDEASVSVADIREEQEYDGYRVTLTAHLEQARINLQIDIGFGDVVTPSPEEIRFPVMLDMPAPILRSYSRESVIAEKYEAMVRLGIANSRMKDFCDIWMLSETFDFKGATLSDAIQATFARRKTALPTEPPMALSEEFSGDSAKMVQWNAFVKRANLNIPVGSLIDTVQSLRAFLMPPTESLANGSSFDLGWTAGGPWK